MGVHFAHRITHLPVEETVHKPCTSHGHAANNDAILDVRLSDALASRRNTIRRRFLDARRGGGALTTTPPRRRASTPAPRAPTRSTTRSRPPRSRRSASTRTPRRRARSPCAIREHHRSCDSTRPPRLRPVDGARECFHRTFDSKRPRKLKASLDYSPQKQANFRLLSEVML